MNKKITLVSSLLCITLLLSANTQAAEKNKIGIVIECESINKLLADINTVSQSLDLKLQSAKTEIILSEMFKSPELAGISSNKPFQACVVFEQRDPALAQSAPKAPGDSFVLVIPVTDKGITYLKSAGKGYGKSEKEKSLTHLSLPTGDRPSDKSDFYVGITGDKAVLGHNAENVEMVMSSQDSITAWKSDFAVVSGTLRVGIDIASVIPPIESMMQKTTAMLKQMPPPTAQGVPAMANPGQILSAEGDVLIAIMKQLRSYVVGIGVKGKALEINAVLSPSKEGQLAGMTKNLTPPSSRYVSAMPAGAFVATAGSGMNIIDLFIEPYSVMMSKLSDAAGPDGSKAGAQMKDLVLSMKGCFSGDHALGVVAGATPKDIALVQMVGVNDPVKFKKLVLDGFAAANIMYSALKTGMTLTVEKSRTSGGYEVIPYTISCKPPTNSMQKAAIPAMGLFSNFKAEMAIIGKDVIYTMGGGPAVMDAAIARIKTGGASVQSSKAFSILFPKVSARTISIHSIELTRLLKAYLATVPNGEQMIQMIPDTNSGIAGFSMLRGADICSVTRIGFDEMAGIKNSIPALGMMMMPLMMGGMNQQAAKAGNTGLDAKCVNNLRMLDAAKEQCALERGLKTGDAINPAWITKYLLRGKMPACPAGGAYTINAVGKEPTCSTPGHVLK